MCLPTEQYAEFVQDNGYKLQGEVNIKTPRMTVTTRFRSIFLKCEDPVAKNEFSALIIPRLATMGLRAQFGSGQADAGAREPHRWLSRALRALGETIEDSTFNRYGNSAGPHLLSSSHHVVSGKSVAALQTVFQNSGARMSCILISSKFHAADQLKKDIEADIQKFGEQYPFVLGV